MYAAGPFSVDASNVADPLIFCCVALNPVFIAWSRTRRFVLPSAGGTSRSSMTNMYVALALAIALVTAILG